MEGSVKSKVGFGIGKITVGEDALTFWITQVITLSASIGFVMVAMRWLASTFPRLLGWLDIFGSLGGASFLVLTTWGHEILHLLGLSIFGIQAAGPFIILMVGGILVPRRKPNPWEKMIFAMAGPAFGLSAFLFVPLGKLLNNPLFFGMGLWIAFTNAFNLPPIYPMDGGHVVGELLASFWWGFPRLLRALSVLPLVGFAFFYPALVGIPLALSCAMWLLDAKLSAYFQGTQFLEEFLGVGKGAQTLEGWHVLATVGIYVVLLGLLAAVTWLNFQALMPFLR